MNDRNSEPEDQTSSSSSDTPRTYILNGDSSAKPMAPLHEITSKPKASKQKSDREYVYENEPEVGDYRLRKHIFSLFMNNKVIWLVPILIILCAVDYHLWLTVWAKVKIEWHKLVTSGPETVPTPNIHLDGDFMVIKNILLIIVFVAFVAYCYFLAKVIVKWRNTYYISSPAGFEIDVIGIPGLLKTTNKKLGARSIDSTEKQAGVIREKLFHYGTIETGIIERENGPDHNDNPTDDFRVMDYIPYPQRFLDSLQKTPE